MALREGNSALQWVATRPEVTRPQQPWRKATSFQSRWGKHAGGRCRRQRDLLEGRFGPINESTTRQPGIRKIDGCQDGLT